MEDGIPPFLDELPPPPGEGFAALLPSIALGLAFVLLLVALILLFIRRLRRPSPPPPLPQYLAIAQEELNLLLAQIRSASPPSAFEVGTRVSSTIRAYLGAQLAVPLLPRTTQEIDRAASLASLADLPRSYLPLACRCDDLTFGTLSLPPEDLAQLVSQALETLTPPRQPEAPPIDPVAAIAAGGNAIP